MNQPLPTLACASAAAALSRPLLGSTLRCRALTQRIRLRRAVAEGPFSVHYEAEHLATGEPVRVEIFSLRGQGTGSQPCPRQLEVFEGELKRLSHLLHPTMPALLDAGWFGAAAPTDDPLAPVEAVVPALAGFALVYAPLPAGRPQAQPLDWPALYDLSLRLLDALAHAHARGLRHGQLGPQMLHGSREDLQLSGFGSWEIARRLHNKRSEAARPCDPRAAQKTPSPRIDLLGAFDLLHTLAAQSQRAGLTIPPAYLRWLAALGGPRLAPTASEAELWATLQRLAEVAPAQRRAHFQRAARAAAALAPLGPEPAPGTLPSLRPLLQLSAAEERARINAGSGAPPPQSAVEAPPSGEAPSPGRIPEDWRSSDAAQPAAAPALHAAQSLALWAMRPAPMAGREAQRDRLWALLREAHTHNEPRFVLLSGAADLGMRCLARWLSQRVAEQGLASFAAPAPVTEQLQIAVVSGPAHLIAQLDTIEAALRNPQGAQLIIVALADSALVRLPRQAERLRALTQSPRGLHLRLRPVDRAQHTQTVRRMLPLTAQSLQAVLQLSWGYPGWAHRCLTAWAQAGQLVATAQGLQLAPGVGEQPPDAALAPWRGLVDEALWSAGPRLDAEHAAQIDDPRALPEDVRTMLARLGLVEGEGAQLDWSHPGVRWALIGRSSDPTRGGANGPPLAVSQPEALC